jgi:hypothetical protein
MREDIANRRITDMSQRSFASAEYALKKKRTRREKFLAGMERVVPWARLIGVIEPLYPTSGRVGRQPIGVPRMLRMKGELSILPSGPQDVVAALQAAAILAFRCWGTTNIRQGLPPSKITRSADAKVALSGFADVQRTYSSNYGEHIVERDQSRYWRKVADGVVAQFARDVRKKSF